MPHFVRTRPAPQVSGGYRYLRPYVREDFRRGCAYCLLLELLAAGEENFELDHFRPKSLFPQLTNDFYNLYYTCHPCNRIKLDLWPPPELIARGIGFVDLCSDEFSVHFRQQPDGTWLGRTESGKYTIDKLRLNRKHLVAIRRILKQHGIEPQSEGITEERILRLLR